MSLLLPAFGPQLLFGTPRLRPSGSVVGGNRPELLIEKSMPQGGYGLGT